MLMFDYYYKMLKLMENHLVNHLLFEMENFEIDHKKHKMMMMLLLDMLYELLMYNFFLVEVYQIESYIVHL